jgi:hypothetical protein
MQKINKKSSVLCNFLFVFWYLCREGRNASVNMAPEFGVLFCFSKLFDYLIEFLIFNYIYIYIY